MTKRKVAILKERKGANRRKFDGPSEELGPVRPVNRNAPVTIPTGDRRHLGKIREGNIVYKNVFAKDVIRKLAVDPDVREGGGKADNANQKLQEGSEKGVPGNDKTVRKEKGKASVLRDGKQAGQRKFPDGKSKQRVPKAEVNTKAAKQRKKAHVTKRERKHGPGLGKS